MKMAIVLEKAPTRIVSFLQLCAIRNYSQMREKIQEYLMLRGIWSGGGLWNDVWWHDTDGSGCHPGRKRWQEG